jgi:polysaccharide deacetylase 2 family uncharacterized protein YibQ
MAETDTVDDLSAPLGQKTARKRRFRLPFTAMQVLAGALGLFLAVFAGFAIFGNNPLGGEPVARVALREGKSSEDKAVPASDHGVKSAPKQIPSGEPKTVTIIDGSSGTHHDVVIGSEGADKPQGSGSQGDSPQGDKTQGDKAEGGSAALAKMAGVDPQLLEKSRYGMIPVISGGRKPFTVYAAPSDPAKAAKMPVVAIVIGGLGVGAAKTADAIMKLPPAVTLAFTPYGSDPSKLAERARAQRHEILLQIPMEPYDYPDNDPGPQTLLATLSPEQNLDRFLWHLGRLQGYAAIANFMGARFVATDAAMQPIIREASKRGLGYFDDGSAPRSVAAALAMGQAMPFAKSDVAIDAVPTPAEIDHALADLENLAKERGVAIGTASALPVSIERIGIWIKTLEARGVMLVPLTTAMLKSKSS